MSKPVRVPASSRFIPPSFPTLRNVPSSVPDWLHEIKFDGYRVQLHKLAKGVVIYSRRGRGIAPSAKRPPCRRALRPPNPPGQLERQIENLAFEQPIVLQSVPPVYISWNLSAAVGVVVRARG